MKQNIPTTQSLAARFAALARKPAPWRRAVTLATLAILLGGIVSTAQATLQVYEPFNYTMATSLAGKVPVAPAKGILSGTWSATASVAGQYFITNGLLTVNSTLGTHQVSPHYNGAFSSVPYYGNFFGRSQLASTGSEGNIYGYIQLDSGIASTFTEGATTWMACVATGTDDRNEQLNFALSQNPPTSSTVMGGPSIGVSWTGSGNGPVYYVASAWGWSSPYTAGLSATGPNLSAVTGTLTNYNNYPSIVVAKIVWHDSGANVVSMWVFRDGDALSETTFSTSAVSKTANTASGIDNTLFKYLVVSGTKFVIDEIRIGTTFNDVIGVVAAADAAQSTVVANPAPPTTVLNDGSATATITVTLKDASGNPLQGKTVTLASSRGATDTITLIPSGSGTKSDPYGVVTFTVKSSTAGSPVFTATDTSDSPNVTVGTATVSFAAPGGTVSAANSTVTASPATVVANGSSSATVTVTVNDTLGSPVTGKAVSLASSRGATDTISAPSGLSDASGVVTFTVTSTTIGSPVFTATETTDTPNVPINQTATTTFTAGTATAGNSSTVVASPFYANVPNDGVTAATITVTLRDAYNNPVPGKAVSLASSRGATDTISAPSGTSSASGVVSFTVKSATLGAAVFTATDTDDSVGVTQTATVNFTAATGKINVNIDTNTWSGLFGPAESGASGETWNAASTAAATNFVDSAGWPTTLGYTSSANGLWNTHYIGAFTLSLLDYEFYNFLGTGATPSQTLVLTGLPVGNQYNVYIASAHIASLGSQGEWATTNPTTTSSPQVVSNGTSGWNSTTWVEGTNYVLFRNVQSDSNGKITFTAQTLVPQNIPVPLNGFQLVPVLTVATATALDSSANPAVPGASVTFTATVEANSAPATTATGSFVFLVNDTPVATNDIVSGGQASYSTSALGHGSNTVTAQYLGDATFLTSTGTLAQVVNTPPVGQDITMGAEAWQAATIQIIGSSKYAPTDADGDSMVVSAVQSNLVTGIAWTDGTNITYTATNSAPVTNSFAYVVSDIYGGRCTNTLTVYVAAQSEGFNKVSADASGMTYAGIPGFKYALDQAPSLTPPVTWTPVVTNTADDHGGITFTNTATGFYRTRWVP